MIDWTASTVTPAIRPRFMPTMAIGLSEQHAPVSWDPCKGWPADFDGNGTVGASDLLALLANWGPCT